MDKKLIREYAELVIKKGLAIRKGQKLVIKAYTGPECIEFTRLAAEAAYESGARDVVVKWTDEEVDRLRWLKADAKVFEAMDPWDIEESDSYGDSDTALLMI